MSINPLHFTRTPTISDAGSDPTKDESCSSLFQDEVLPYEKLIQAIQQSDLAEINSILETELSGISYENLIEILEITSSLSGTDIIKQTFQVFQKKAIFGRLSQEAQLDLLDKAICFDHAEAFICLLNHFTVNVEFADENYQKMIESGAFKVLEAFIERDYFALISDERILESLNTLTLSEAKEGPRLNMFILIANSKKPLLENAQQDRNKMMEQAVFSGLEEICKFLLEYEYSAIDFINFLLKSVTNNSSLASLLLNHAKKIGKDQLLDLTERLIQKASSSAAACLPQLEAVKALIQEFQEPLT